MALNILIVEDEWFIAEENAHAVRRVGHTVVGPVPSVKAALVLLEGQKIDIALLDVQLNGETSYALADTLYEMEIAFAFVTGHGEKDLPPRFANIPMLQKPAAADAIKATIERLLLR